MVWCESLFPTSPQPAEFGVGRVALSVEEGFSYCCSEAVVGKGVFLDGGHESIGEALNDVQKYPVTA